MVNFSKKMSINSRTAICQLGHKRITSDHLPLGLGNMDKVCVSVIYHDIHILQSIGTFLKIQVR